WNMIFLSIEEKGTCNTNRNRYVSDNIFATGSHDLRIVIRGVGKIFQAFSSRIEGSQKETANVDSSLWIIQGCLQSIWLKGFLLAQHKDFFVSNFLGTVFIVDHREKDFNG